MICCSSAMEEYDCKLLGHIDKQSNVVSFSRRVCITELTTVDLNFVVIMIMNRTQGKFAA